jgi:hypothetical protein
MNTGNEGWGMRDVKRYGFGFDPIPHSPFPIFPASQRRA